jgi:hypothetical protein
LEHSLGLAAFSRRIERHMASSMKGVVMVDCDKSASFQERLSAFAEDEKNRAKLLPPGPEREIALRKVRQAETAAHLDEWANSPGLKPPT